MSTTPQTGAAPSGRVSLLVDKAIYQLATHWLALVNLFWALYVGLPLLAPALMNAGFETPAKIIYTVYRPACHQLPERSYFVGGPQIVYSVDELEAGGVHVAPFSRDIGNETVGWKVAFCERDLAIYGTILLTGLFYGVVRRWRGQRRMPFKVYLIFLVPMAVDGLLQLFGLHESTWVLRTITGVIFGAGSVLFAYPYLDEGFADVRKSLTSKLQPEDA